MLSSTNQASIRAMIREHQQAVDALTKLVGNGAGPVRRRRRTKLEMQAAAAVPVRPPHIPPAGAKRKRKAGKPASTTKPMHWRTRRKLEAAQKARKLESTLESAEG